MKEDPEKMWVYLCYVKILHIKPVSRNDDSGMCYFISRYLFLELVTGGDLFGYVVRHKRLGVSEAKYIMYQLLQAVTVSVDTFPCSF